MEDFVTFEIAKKLKEKGFTCKYPFAMYNELGGYYPLTTSSDYATCESGYKYRCYYDYNDFDKNDFIAPTISQVLKWLREEKRIYVALDFSRFNGNTELWWIYTIRYIEDDSTENIFESCKRKSWEQAAIAGIEYVLENII